MKKLHSPYLNRAWFLVHLVTMMSICDICFETLKLRDYLSFIFNSVSKTVNKTDCIIEAFLNNFSGVAGMSWNCIMSVIFLRILISNQTDLKTFSNEIIYYHIYVWCISLLCSIIPLIYNAYGFIDDMYSGEYECWINKEYFGVNFYGIASIYMLISIFLLIYCVYIKYCSKNDKKRITYLNNQLIYYTIVFIITWIFPTILRMKLIFEKNNNAKANAGVAKYLFWLHHICNGSVCTVYYVCI